MKMTSLRFLIPVVSISLLYSLAACNSKKKEEEEAKPKTNILNAEGYVVKPQAFQSDYTASGSLLPNEEIQILPEVSGRVTNISFEEGTHVSAGQVLLKIYNDDIRAQIQKSKAQRELQEKIKLRQVELLRIGGISQQDYETTTAQIQSINADLAYSDALLRKTTIVAPFSGRIGIRNVSKGAVVTPTTVIATLQQTKILKMDFTIPDQYRDEVNPGKKITFTVTGKLDTFSAVISAVEPAADVITRTLKVRALVQNQEHKLTAGSFTHVIIPFENNKNALLIPSEAIIPTSRDKEVAVVSGGKAKMVVVKIGTRTNDMVEIVQGLKEGDTIITTGIMQVKPNMQVRVRIPQTPKGASPHGSDTVR
ncbi:MAG: efflux transporter periplasmic adaptor subunit [Flavipsychrobacter sp.]|nr:efflux transporter periplasmic adaptor subunit [Flavipsychrobacter sp.]